ncbi:hypothetical protein VTL71DRAFT_12118 [Oculimacula yallundae]|uniref:Uncharacterized protein n=1 Tax=Oculimacula yallundae TaxID=86028 RepID=A0ABR4CSC6_9HELO
MHQYIVERNVWRRLYSDQYGNTIPRFPGIKPSPTSTTLDTPRTTTWPESAQKRSSATTNNSLSDTKLLTIGGSRDEEQPSLHRQSQGDSSTDKLEVVASPLEISSNLSTTFNISRGRPQSRHYGANITTESSDNHTPRSKDAAADRLRMSLKNKFDDSKFLHTLPIGYRPSRWDERRGCPQGAVFTKSNNAYAAINGMRGSHLVLINARIGFDVKTGTGRVRVLFLRDPFGSENITTMLWTDVGKGQQWSNPLKQALIKWFQEFIENYARSRDDVPGIHKIFEAWEQYHRPPPRVDDYLQSKIGLRTLYTIDNTSDPTFFTSGPPTRFSTMSLIKPPQDNGHYRRALSPRNERRASRHEPTVKRERSASPAYGRLNGGFSNLTLHPADKNIKAERTPSPKPRHPRRRDDYYR